jgi:hypothetical protein
VSSDDDVIERFNSLDIGEFYTHSFAYWPMKKLIFRLMDAERVHRTTQDSVASDYELQFNRILGGRIDAMGPWPGEVKRWKAYRDSKFLIETLRARKHLTYGEDFAHFELTCDQGRFDVVARDFFLTVTGKSELMRNGDDGGAGNPLSVPKNREAE